MTLIISSLRPTDLLITADGRSITSGPKIATSINDHFRKIFPIPEHPIVIFNHGENRLNNLPLGEFIANFVKNLNTGNHTIEEIGDELRHYAHPYIRTRLKTEVSETRTCGLCVAGFGTHPDDPRLMEIFWKLDKDCLLTEERQWSPTTIVPSGNGTKQISPVSWKEIQGKSLEQMQHYHQSLMDQAINAKLPQNPVGGQVHEVYVTKYGWQWTKPPTS
jgi:hypothetical protein